MKRFAVILLIALGGAAGFARWLDLVNYTDPSTGFVLVGSVWLRYGVLGVLLLLAALAALLAPRGSSLGARRAPGLCAVALVSAAAFAALAAAQFVAAPFLSLVRVALNLLTAWWLVTLALNWCETAARRPASGVYGGIAGTVSFYLLAVQRFMQDGSSYHRTEPVTGVLAALLALVFAVKLLYAVQSPRCGNGRGLVFAGLACFYLCSCVRLPQAVFGWVTGSMALSAVAQDLVLAVFGFLGAAVAFCAASSAQSVAQPEEMVQNA